MWLESLLITLVIAAIAVGINVIRCKRKHLHGL